MQKDKLNEEKPTIQQVLGMVQGEMRVPKNQFNKFGGYNYRSCEDIVEAAKPVCAKYGCTLTLSDEVVMLGSRFYIKATAAVSYNGETYCTTAYAREEETKKGMDASQITGSASSYARKYALNGLFCLDDTKDADATNTHGKEAQQQPRAQQAPNIREQILAATSVAKLGELWNSMSPASRTTDIVAVFTQRRKELENNLAS